MRVYYAVIGLIGVGVNIWTAFTYPGYPLVTDLVMGFSSGTLIAVALRNKVVR